MPTAAATWCPVLRWSWDQPFAVDRLAHLAGKLVCGGLRVDAGHRRQRRGDPRRYRLVDRRERTHRRVGELTADDRVGRILELELRIVVERTPHGGQATLDRQILLVLCVAQ